MKKTINFQIVKRIEQIKNVKQAAELEKLIKKQIKEGDFDELTGDIYKVIFHRVKFGEREIRGNFERVSEILIEIDDGIRGEIKVNFSAYYRGWDEQEKCYMFNVHAFTDPDLDGDYLYLNPEYDSLGNVVFYTFQLFEGIN